MTTPLRYPDLATALKDAQANPHDRRASRKWEVIVAAIERAARQQRLHQQIREVVSATFLRVCDSRSVFLGTTEGEARSYIYRLVRSSFIDEVRRERKHGRVRLRPAQDDHDPLELLATPEPDPSASRTPEQERRALAELKDRLHGRIDAHIEQLPLRDPEQRQLRWNEAMAAMLTLVDKLGAKAIARELGVSEASSARIHKWKERGQALVLAVLEEWSADADPQDEQAVEYLRGLFSERRADAGKARPQRKNRGKSGGNPPTQAQAVSPCRVYASVQYAGRGSKRRGSCPSVHRTGRAARREVPSV